MCSAVHSQPLGLRSRLVTSSALVSASMSSSISCFSVPPASARARAKAAPSTLPVVQLSYVYGCPKRPAPSEGGLRALVLAAADDGGAEELTDGNPDNVKLVLQ